MEPSRVTEQLAFANRGEFRKWLQANHNASNGIWVVLSKRDDPWKLTSAQALEEALCFGWIDGLIKSLGPDEYVKKFTPRTPDSTWSETNRTLAERLIRSGRMCEPGLAAIERARTKGKWDTQPRERASDEQVKVLVDALQGSDLALANFTKMARSVRRTYADFYLDAKKEETRVNRLKRIIERLNANKGPM